jgi:hypothetical protein
MNGEHLCSEHEAAALAGVSLRTLMRFSEAGYLKLHTADDGSLSFERSQVQDIFGISGQGGEVADINAKEQACSGETADEQSTCASGAAPKDDDYCQHSSARDSQTTKAQFDTHEPIQGVESGLKSNAQKTPVSDEQNKSEGSYAEAALEEVARLRNLLTMQERILDSKDDEIADLRSQRAWLRERIEKLEEKSDRDQILLLSETQMIRSLIAYQETRKSTFRQFLEWTGIVRGQQQQASLPQSQQGDYHSSSSSQSGSSRTIDVSIASNRIP